MTARNASQPVALAVVTAIFFMWGFITVLNDVLIPHLKSVFTLNYAQAMLVQFIFFGAYFVMSLPAGRVVARLGYRGGIVIGLAVTGIGALLFVPAARMVSYEVFLAAFFVLATGITLLQVAANPYVSLLGDAICQQALQQRHHGAADDRHDQQARGLVGHRSEAFDAEREDVRKHDRIEQADRDDAAHGDVARAAHADHEQGPGDCREQREQPARIEAAQQQHAGEAPDHRAAPIQRDVAGGGVFAETADVRLRQIVDQEAADRDFGADIQEDADHAIAHVAVTQHLGKAMRCRVAARGRFGKRRQAARPCHQRKHEQGERDHQVRKRDQLRLLRLVRRARGRFQLCIFGRTEHRAGKDQHAAELGCQGRAERVQRLCKIEPARCVARIGVQHAFVLPLLCYAYIVWYGLRGSRIDDAEGLSAMVAAVPRHLP